MNCNCIRDINKKLKTSCLDIELIDGCLDIDYTGCACGEFEEIIEINYCPICGKKIIQVANRVEEITTAANKAEYSLDDYIKEQLKIKQKTSK